MEQKGALTLDEFQRLEERVCVKRAADPEEALREVSEKLDKLSRRFRRIEKKLGLDDSDAEVDEVFAVGSTVTSANSGSEVTQLRAVSPEP